MALGLRLWPACSFQLLSIWGKSENAHGDWGTVPALCACVLVLPKSRVSGERPVPAVVPGPLGEPGVGRQLRHWTSPRRLLQTLPGGGVGLCQPAVGVRGGSGGRALFLRASGMGQFSLQVSFLQLLDFFIEI